MTKNNKNNKSKKKRLSIALGISIPLVAAAATTGIVFGVKACKTTDREVELDDTTKQQANVTTKKTSSGAVEITITPKDSGKKIESIESITIGNSTLTADQYTFDKESGKITIKKEVLDNNPGNIIVKPTIIDKEVSGIKLSVETKEIKVNESFDIKATLLYSTNTPAEINWTVDEEGFVQLDKTKTLDGGIVSVKGLKAGCVKLTATCNVQERHCAINCAITIKDSGISVTSITSAVFTGTSGTAGEATPKEEFGSSKLTVRGRISGGSEQDLEISIHYSVRDFKGTDVTSEIVAKTYTLPEIAGTYTYTVVGVGQAGVSKKFDIKVVEPITPINKATFIEKMNAYAKNYNDNVGLITPNCITSATKGGQPVTQTQINNEFFTDGRVATTKEITELETGIASTYIPSVIAKLLPDDGENVLYTEDSTNQIITMTITDATSHEVTDEFQMNGFGIFTKICWSYLAEPDNYFTLTFDGSKLIGIPKIDLSDASKAASISIADHTFTVDKNNFIKPQIYIKGTSTAPTVNSITINGKQVTDYTTEVIDNKTKITFKKFIDLKTTDKIEIDATTVNKTQINWSNSEGFETLGISIIKDGTTAEFDETSKTISLKYTCEVSKAKGTELEFFETDLSFYNSKNELVFKTPKLHIIDTDATGKESDTITFDITDFSKITAGETLTPKLRQPKVITIESEISLPNCENGKNPGAVYEGNEIKFSITNYNTESINGSYTLIDSKGQNVAGPNDLSLPYEKESQVTFPIEDWSVINDDATYTIVYNCDLYNNVASVEKASSMPEGFDVTLPGEGEDIKSTIWQRDGTEPYQIEYTYATGTGTSLHYKAELIETLDSGDTQTIYESDIMVIDDGEAGLIEIEPSKLDWNNLKRHALTLNIKEVAHLDIEMGEVPELDCTITSLTDYIHEGSEIIIQFTDATKPITIPANTYIIWIYGIDWSEQVVIDKEISVEPGKQDAFSFVLPNFSFFQPGETILLDIEENK